MVNSGKQVDILESDATLSCRDSIDLSLTSGSVVVGKLVNFVTDDLKAPQLWLVGDNKLEEVILLATREPPFNPVIGGHRGSVFDIVIGLGLDPGLDGALGIEGHDVFSGLGTTRNLQPPQPWLKDQVDQLDQSCLGTALHSNTFGIEKTESELVLSLSLEFQS